jgi:methylmalonyl-CoA mutase C-terminal domain/subunit
MSKKIRVIVAKAGLDGHDRGAKVIAAALRDAGMEVIYTGLRQTPEMIVEAAIQEDADVIGISILSGAHMTVFPKILNILKEKNIDDVLLTGGGIFPEEDIKKLKKLGTGELFTPGATTTDISGYIKEWCKTHPRK